MPSRRGLIQLGQGSLNANQSPFLQHGHKECAVSGVWLWQKRWGQEGDPCVAEGDAGRFVAVDVDNTEGNRGEARQSRPTHVPGAPIKVWGMGIISSQEQAAVTDNSPDYCMCQLGLEKLEQ